MQDFLPLRLEAFLRELKGNVVVVDDDVVVVVFVVFVFVPVV